MQLHIPVTTCRLLFDSQPAVLDNLLTSIKFVLQGMGMLRINLANKNNKASRDGAGSSLRKRVFISLIDVLSLAAIPPVDA